MDKNVISFINFDNNLNQIFFLVQRVSWDCDNGEIIKVDKNVDFYATVGGTREKSNFLEDLKSVIADVQNSILVDSVATTLPLSNLEESP